MTTYSDIFSHIVAYLETLAYSELCHIQNPGIFRTVKAYSGSLLFRYIQAYLGIFNNNSYNNINSFFFSLQSYILFNKIYEAIYVFDYKDVNFNVWLSLLKYYAIFQNSVTIKFLIFSFKIINERIEQGKYKETDGTILKELEPFPSFLYLHFKETLLYKQILPWSHQPASFFASTKLHKFGNLRNLNVNSVKLLLTIVQAGT